MARQRGWKVVLRIEDLDGPRVKPEAVDGIQRTLEWLGLDWDEGPYIQSDDLSAYREAIKELAAKGAVFPCALTRGEIARAASAPQEGSHELRYDASLRPKAWERRFEDAASHWRFLVDPGPVGFEDGVHGPQSLDPAAIIGDFIVWTKRGTPAYQLAVVVDDHRQGITQVVRGDDLLDSTPRQLLLWRALGLSPEPAYFHLPLIIGPDGKRLAKRHGDSRIDHYRERGVAPEAVIGLLASWSGVKEPKLDAREFAQAFDLAKLPRAKVVFTPDDDARLR